jgi:hypothetical protein
MIMLVVVDVKIDGMFELFYRADYDVLVFVLVGDEFLPFALSWRLSPLGRF